MKKFAAAAAVLLLAAVMLAGCVSINIEGSTPSPTPKEFTRGTIDGNVYKSEYADIKFTAPDGWVYSTDEEISKLMGISADKLSDAGMKVSDEMLKLQSIYDMMAINNTTGSNVIVMYQNLSLLGASVTSEEDYLNLTKTGLDQAKVYNYEYGDITDKKIGSNTFKVLPAVMTDYNTTQYYCVRKIDKYMFGLIITLGVGEELSDALPYFS